MKVIVGLGNPGSNYTRTRHNAGFMVVTALSQQWSIPMNQRLTRAKVGQGLVGSHPVRLVLPQTSMNLSGESVGLLIRRWKLEPSELLVVCDDISLPLGLIRLRGQGSDGGHRGLSSVLQAAGTTHIPRLRVGIRAKNLPKDLTAYVLGRFSLREWKLMGKSIRLGSEACEVWLRRGLSTAMNQFNQKVTTGV